MPKNKWSLQHNYITLDFIVQLYYIMIVLYINSSTSSCCAVVTVLVAVERTNSIPHSCQCCPASLQLPLTTTTAVLLQMVLTSTYQCKCVAT